MDRASQRFFFGWGRYGRNRIFNERGEDTSVSDGRWVLTLGQFGIFGFLAEFGLLALPVLRAASCLKFVESPRDAIFLSALALIIALNMVDLIPNASLSPWTWLLTGALLGRTEALRGAARQLAFRSSHLPGRHAAGVASEDLTIVTRPTEKSAPSPKGYLENNVMVNAPTNAAPLKRRILGAGAWSLAGFVLSTQSAWAAA